ncbi:nucleotidyl transferase AbiEii/AbiGii toxin family protein [Hymenobacter metallicola]|uniref:Nucleotidyl transferase AbiEii/AbiGii toxin family protein n=1 Tax=Hymenobacter metallicola TaxID=2563114 RepID=A0A4Z0PUD1_9BACT|nr:nucleotidyl transferase AbiEii/AbiGii toxin family protein [Hymenobacter metallicola]TGE20899.1 hypothetical protein E5K02_25190 [Hymenobacter metallicola]
MSNAANLAALQAVARALGPLRERVVFVGGSTAGLYSTAARAAESRPTIDVDCIIEVVPHTAYYALEEKLRALGFRHDQESKVICRWRVAGLVVDVMPVGEDNIMGFSNPWYPEGFAHAIPYALPNRTTIQIMPAVYFIATKLAALRGRGMSDIRLSNDLEDIVYVLDNRPALGVEVAAASPAVRSYIATEVSRLLQHPELREAIDCQLPYGSGDERKFIIERRLHSLVSVGQ